MNLPLLRDMEADSHSAFVWESWDEWNHIFDDPFRIFLDSLKTANFD
jgi:hypothetical protein